jgi:hypothetical protein
MIDRDILSDCLKALLSTGQNAESNPLVKSAVKKIRKRLKQPELSHKKFTDRERDAFIVGYQKAALKKKEWVGLTDEEIDTAVKSCNTVDTYKYFRAIEAKLKEKNS